MPAPDDLFEELSDDLTDLGRALRVAPPADDLVVRVLTRISAAPTRGRRIRRELRRRLSRSRRRVIAVGIIVVLVVLGLTPPVRAAIRDWLEFGGVVIRTQPPATSTAPTSPVPDPVPSGDRVVGLDEARAAVGFDLGLPAGLGAPDRITVSDDRRVVGMTWGEGADALHLDQFDGTISWVFVKQIQGGATFTDVSDRDAVWIAEAHPIGYLDRDGTERTAANRISGPSLIWERDTPRGTITSRLEGPGLSLDRARTVAESVR